MMKKILIQSAITFFVLCVSPFIVKSVAHAAAQVYPSPGSGSYNVGNSFTVGVYVNATEPINAVQTNIGYDSAKLTIQSCTSGGTGFNTPIPTSTTGCTNLAAGTTGTFQGNGGQIGTITFLVINSGNTTVTVTGSAANNGAAVSTSGGSGTFNLSVYVPPEQPAAKPSVSSATHPKEDTWYNKKEGALSWDKKTGVTGFSYVLDQKKSTNPAETINITANTLALNLTTQGVWYFHIRAYSSGGWSSATHYTIMYDASAPDITNAILNYHGDLQPELTFTVSDNLSGVSSSTVSIDGGSVFDATSPYKSEILPLGAHTFSLMVTDKAGNKASKDFEISFDSIDQPVLTELGFEQVFVGSSTGRLRIEGTAPFNALVIITIQPINLVFETRANEEGKWSYTYSDHLEDGEYTITLQTQIGSITSKVTDPLSFQISKNGLSSLPLTGGNQSSALIWGVSILILIGVVSAGIYWYLKKKRNRPTKLLSGGQSPISPQSQQTPSIFS